jgi:hypothetical protein
MFKNQQFYHQHVKKAITVFGLLFTNININRVDGSNVTQQVIRVPLSYSTKQKFLSRIALVDDADERGEVAITLPRMGFEIQGFEFDPGRKISPVQKNKAIIEGEANTGISRSFVSTPWNMSLSLYIFAKNQEDGLQIVEQIMPFFNPDFNITVNELPELGIKRDINIKLDSVDYDDNYEGELAVRQSIIWTFNFTMKLNFYGYVSNQNIIRTAIANAYATPDTLTSNNDYTKITTSVLSTTATANAKISGGSVSEIYLTYQGAGYLNAPSVTLSGGGGSGAAASSILNSDGTINKINITSGGSGYTTAPTVTIEVPPDYVSSPTPADPYRFIAEFDNVFAE